SSGCIILSSGKRGLRSMILGIGPHAQPEWLKPKETRRTTSRPHSAGGGDSSDTLPHTDNPCMISPAWCCGGTLGLKVKGVVKVKGVGRSKGSELFRPGQSGQKGSGLANYMDEHCAPEQA